METRQIESLRSAAESLGDQIISWRREFHRRPELELGCHRTAELIARELGASGASDLRQGLAESGLTAVVSGGQPGPTVGLRVDMDALPISEETGVDFASECSGVSHACGHDGHIAIALGVARVLRDSGVTFPGKVKFIFEPGEEYPGGAALMIRDGALREPRVEGILGYHIFPGLEQGTYGLREGTMCASNDEFTVEIAGHAGHGAYPHLCQDPIVAAGSFIVGVQNIVSRMTSPVDPLVVTIGEVHGGKGHNVIPASVTLKGTIRAVSAAGRQGGEEGLRAVARGVEAIHGVTCRVDLIAVEPPLICDPGLTALARDVLYGVVGPGRVRFIDAPSLGAEGFAFYSEVVPATYLRIGSRNPAKGYTSPLHSPGFNFDEAIMPEAAFVLAALALRVLERLVLLR
jgi:amidohydrolase